MVDSVSKETRSAIMRQIRGKDTSPEREVRSALHRAGFRFRLHLRKLPGCPDVVLPGLRTVVFIHGCFWHQHPDCVHSGIPLSHRRYWKPKLMRTVARDAEHLRALRGQGWSVHVLWECKVKETLDRLVERLDRERRRA